MDLSTTYGSNRMEYLISNTLNASYATQNNGLSPTSFDAGGFEFTQTHDQSRFHALLQRRDERVFPGGRVSSIAARPT